VEGNRAGSVGLLGSIKRYKGNQKNMEMLPPGLIVEIAEELIDCLELAFPYRDYQQTLKREVEKLNIRIQKSDGHVTIQLSFNIRILESFKTPVIFHRFLIKTIPKTHHKVHFSSNFTVPLWVAPRLTPIP
jgi:hypothetical protein